MNENVTKSTTRNVAKIITIIVAITVIVAVGITWFIKVQIPHNNAMKDYKAVIAEIDNKNSELDGIVQKIQELIDSGEKPLDETCATNAKETVKKAQAAKVLVEDTPKSTDEVIKKTQELKGSVDYTETISLLNDAYNKLDLSIQQFKQLTNPSEEFVITRLQTVDEIADVRAVTEDNDPNGQLHKQGGYTATVYFESKNVNQSDAYGDNLIDKGTDAGGAVEVYATQEDADKRNTYLSAFDGGALSSGSHKVVGTVIVRTSQLLNASQQKVLEQKVVDALSKIE